MVGRAECSRDDCPPANIQRHYTAKCGNCGGDLHLPCIGIERKVSEVLFHRNIRVYCDGCSSLLPVGMNVEAKPVIKPSTLTAAISGSSSTEANAKLDSIAALLLEVRDIARDTNNKVMSNVDSSQSYANVVKKVDELTEIAVKTNAKVNEKCFPVNDKRVSRQIERKVEPFPLLGTPSKRKRTGSPPALSLSLPPSRKYVGRKLVAGTANVTNHGLGDRVETKVPSRPRLTKAIYVSRMANTVTSQGLLSYMKGQMPELNESDVSLRLLVKKDVDVSTRRFISFRLACIDSLYDKFIDPSFWPDHIEIGEFYEEAREREATKPASLVSIRTARSSESNDVLTEIVEKNIGAVATSSSASKNGGPSNMEIS